MIVEQVRFDAAGLVPAVVQDAADGRVLMVAYMNSEALAATQRTGRVHFWSRSRSEVWEKGRTSGNTLEVDEIIIDCDGDTLLVRVRPAGLVCHTGKPTCFEERAPGQGFMALEGLWSTIVERATRRPTGSYTVELLAGGVDACARKVIEEAGEVVLAAKNQAAGGEDRIAEEAADLVYHLLVLLAERGVTPQQTLSALAERRRPPTPPG